MTVPIDRTGFARYSLLVKLKMIADLKICKYLNLVYKSCKKIQKKLQNKLIKKKFTCS